MHNIDVSSYRKRIIVVNVPRISSRRGAHLGLFVSRPEHSRGKYSVKQGAWTRERFLGIELNQKTLGIIGLGHVGSEVGRRARALGMQVLACDPHISAEHAAKIGVELVELPALLRQADFVSLHVPLMPATRHLIGAEEIALMKPEAMLINCARGGIVDESAPTALVEKNSRGGARCFGKEPPARQPAAAAGQCDRTPHPAPSPAKPRPTWPCRRAGAEGALRGRLPGGERPGVDAGSARRWAHCP